VGGGKAGKVAEENEMSSFNSISQPKPGSQIYQLIKYKGEIPSVSDSISDFA
jgi:hypothetical protein